MTDNKNKQGAERKAWVQPELKRMAAGSAETGTNVSPDSGPLGNAQS